ncbi:MAG: phage head-tail connector protein [Pseudomonadota bacterium]
MITVLTAASSRDLTVLATVKAELNISVTTHDSFLATVIQQASAAIVSFCNREFAQERVKETVPGFGGLFLMVSRLPIATVHAIKEGDDLVTVGASDYALHDRLTGQIRSKVGGWAHSAGQGYGALGRPLPGSETARYEVEYTGGYMLPSMSGTRDLPHDIERACVETVKARYLARTRDPNVTSESADGIYSAAYDGLGSGDVPAGVKALLAPWRRLA